jgi:hypothetical protein
VSDSIDVQKSFDRMKIYAQLRGLRPNTVLSFATLSSGRRRSRQKVRSKACRA